MLLRVNRQPTVPRVLCTTQHKHWTNMHTTHRYSLVIERCLLSDNHFPQSAQVMEFCPHGTKLECSKMRSKVPCKKLHFKKIIQKHTDESLGDCSFLNTCFHMDTCKYVHYEVDGPTVQFPKESFSKIESVEPKTLGRTNQDTTILYPAQWVQCDLRYLDMTVLGKFAVIMADPPWDIHMELPYGTMSDDEMRQLGIPTLQDDGLIFLWVTGRAMELGRDCLKLWGYERVDEIIWVKTNQLQRIIRTGRTGHWLNHGKEHCLVKDGATEEKGRGGHLGYSGKIMRMKVLFWNHQNCSIVFRNEGASSTSSAPKFVLSLCSLACQYQQLRLSIEFNMCPGSCGQPRCLLVFPFDAAGSTVG
uniref:mRNA m(6)A methyltransferase n=1 Tax=Timema tahoe TaxID=61484 RepID=A0A7R9IR10_9NEOP|nr:unnamed protein product [Timema tahoe]